MTSDQIVKFGGSKGDNAPDDTVRLAIVFASEHTSRGSRATGSGTGPSCDGKLRLATDLLDIPADLIAVAYRLKWLIEVDIRSIKSTMQMDILRCKTPEMVHKEIWTHLLAYNLLRTVMASLVSSLRNQNDIETTEA